MKILGYGTFGLVRLAQEKILTTKNTLKSASLHFAIKTVHKNKLTGNVLLYLRREVEGLMSVDHPHIVKLYEAFEDQDSFHLVMELCQGEELFERFMRDGKFSEQETMKIIYQIILAVNHLHLHGVVHRDIKAENIMFKTRNDPKDLDVKLIDFGLSALYNKNNQNRTLQTIVGSPYYLAPEVLDKSYNQQCDMWSVGVLIYFLLSQSFPFSGKTHPEIVKKIKKGQFTPMEGFAWEGVSSLAKDLIKKLLVKDPSKRLTSLQALKHPWFEKEYNIEVRIPLNFYENIRKYQKEKLFTKEALNVMGKFLSDKEIFEQNRIFELIDDDHKGFITCQQLRQVLQENVKQFNGDEAQIQKIIESMDLNHNDIINYSEFIAATIDRDKLVNGKTIQATFQFFDKDNSGEINLQNMKKSLIYLNCGCQLEIEQELLQVKDEDVKKMLNEVSPGKETLSFVEFKSLVDQGKGISQKHSSTLVNNNNFV